jgi:hypothetical protein
MPRPKAPEMLDDEIVTMSVRFPKRVLDSMRRQAIAEERGLNTTIIRALRAYLEAAAKKGGQQK